MINFRISADAAASHISVDERGSAAALLPAAQTPDRRTGNLGLLHELVSAKKLQLKAGFSNRTRTVRPETLENLGIALNAVTAVKGRLAYGQGNQMPDVVHTWGESYVRMWYARQRAEGRSIGATSEVELHHHAEAAVAFQSGNCGETAALSYMQLSAGPALNAPLMLVSDQAQDHDYALIGDPRDPRWGSKNTVVVDAWVQFPAAYTLADADSLIPGPADHQRAPGTQPSTVAQSILFDTAPVSRKSISSNLEEDEHADIGPDLLHEVLQNVEKSDMWDMRVGALDPSTRYTDGSNAPSTFDSLPRSLVHRQERAIEAWESYQKQTGYQLKQASPDE